MVYMVEYITGTEFDVRFDLVKVSFSKVTNIGSKIEYDTFVEGGRNDAPLYFQKPKTKPDTIIFEKGLHNGLTSNFFGLLKEGMHIKNVMIFVKHQGVSKRILYFDDGLIVSKEFSVMDAMSNAVLIEKMEIAHSGLKEIPVVF